MPAFTTSRERKLWTWTALILVLIYSTVGLAGTLVETLMEKGLLENLLFCSFLLVVLSGLIIGLRKGTKWLDIGFGLGVLAVFIFAVLRLGISAVERTHLVEYSIVALLLNEALIERRKGGKRVPFPSLLAVLLTIAFGWIDEGLQALIPNRVYDIVDVAFNSLAGTCAVLASETLRWLRRVLTNNKT